MNQSLKTWLTRNRHKLPLTLHAFLIRQGWIENRGLIYLEQQRITRSDYVDETDVEEAVAHTKERIRENLWTAVLKATKHDFYPREVLIATKEEEYTILVGIRVDLTLRRHITAIEMKKFFEKLYTL